jgi:Tfp pilus assembly protein PilO
MAFFLSKSFYFVIIEAMADFKQEFIKKLLIALLLIAVPLGGLIFFGWNMNRRAEEIKKQRQELTDRSAELSLFARLQSQSAKAESYFSILENILPGRDQLFDFPREMEKLANQEGIGFGFTFGAETPSSADQPGRMSFTIVSQGSLLKIFRFIKAIENSRFLVNFQRFDFTGSAVNINGEVLFH